LRAIAEAIELHAEPDIIRKLRHEVGVLFLNPCKLHFNIKNII